MPSTNHYVSGDYNATCDQLALDLVSAKPKRGKDYDYSQLPKIFEANTKVCGICKKAKELELFSKSKDHPTGRKFECRACASKRHKAWRKKNHEAVKLKDRVTHYIRKYGIPLEEAELLVKDRTGICEICNEQHKLVVDHCHASEKVRGRICSACNSVLGYAKENKETLLSAMAYLEKYGE